MFNNKKIEELETMLLHTIVIAGTVGNIVMNNQDVLKVRKDQFDSIKDSLAEIKIYAERVLSK